MHPKIVVCASGEGTNFEAIVRAAEDGSLKAQIAGLIVNRAGCGALKRAEKLKVHVTVLEPKNFPSREAWDSAMVQSLRSLKADWVALAGFLALVGPRVLSAFPQRVINSHPALLPKFGGAGMYGEFVHAAVIQAGERETGITVHTIDEIYDRGRILAQEKVPVEPGDTAAQLSERVKAREVRFYPKVLNDLVTGRITTG